MFKLILVLTILAFSIYLSAQSWVSFTGEGEQAPEIQEPWGDTPAFMVDVFGMNSINVTENDTIYQRVKIPSWYELKETGKPELPIIRELIAIPECDSVILSSSVYDSVILENYYIYPAPDYEESIDQDGFEYLAEVFSKNDSVYNTNGFCPNVVAEIKDIAYIRDQKIAEVWTYPVQFNPVTRQIKANTNYDVELSFINETSSINKNTGIFSNICENTLLNYTLGGRGAGDCIRFKTKGNVEWIEVNDTSGQINADYLIIVANEFFDISNHNPDIETFANHKADYNGFDVAIVNIDDVLDIYTCIHNPDFPDWDNERKIRNFIKSVYYNGTANHTGDGHLGYVLLIGDSEGVSHIEALPSSYEVVAEKASDYYYSCLTESYGFYDDYPELFIGRFPVENSTLLHNMAEKIITHENQDSYSIWRDEVILSVGDDENFNEEIEEILDDVEQNMIPENFNVHRINTYELGNSVYDIMVNTINEGSQFLNYNGHGGVWNWQSLAWPQYDDIMNMEKQPYIVAIACKTGQFDYFNPPQQCIAEYFTTSANRGSIGYLGASALTYQGANLLLIEYINHAFWVDKMYISSEFITQSKILLPDTYQIDGHYHRYVYNDLGDPSVNIMAGYFTADVPENIQVLEDSNNVTITWDIADGATSYNVYSSNMPYEGYTLEDTVMNPTWNSTLPENKKFFYITSNREIGW